MKSLKIGLLGLGNIGSGVFTLLQKKSALLKDRSGTSFEIVRIADRSRSFSVSVNKKIVTKDVQSVLTDPDIDVIVELFGGIHPALEHILFALKNGKDVVTANKALLAEHGEEIFRTAENCGRRIYFEASVGGGIPVIQTLREGLVANQVESIHSIINGTCNYILTQMTQKRVDFSVALKEAQSKGYAEANPRLDIEGHDAAHKIAILASLAFGKIARYKDVYVEGITQIRNEDIAFAEEFGYRIKLLAIAKRSSNGIEARVQPTLVRKDHLLANVNNSFNAILIKSDETGDIFLYGRGAGRKPTASAVVSDLVALAKDRERKTGLISKFPSGRLAIKNISSILSRYYLRIHVADKSGVLAKITQALGKYKVSISDVIQKEWDTGKIVPLILLTHDTHEDRVRAAVKSIDRLGVVRGKTQVLRMEA